MSNHSSMLTRAFKCVFLTQACVLIMYVVYSNTRNHHSHTRVIRRPLLRINTTLDRDLKTIDGFEGVQENKHVLVDNVTVYDESCHGLTFPRQFATDSLWMPVGGDRLAFVYSAYHTFNTGHKIVVIGAKTMLISKAVCQVWYRSDNNSENIYMKEGLAYAKSLPESHGKRYSAAFFECTIGSDIIPKYVSIVTTSCDVPKNLLTVRPAIIPTKFTRNFTVCLPPFNLHYSKAFELVEWIELNTILGADKFIVYNHSVANNVARVLDYYSRRGVVKVLPWNLPLSVPFFPIEKTPSEIHYFGQVAALNDCLYRNKHMSEFVVNLDLDEFIVPHSINLKTWYDLINMKLQRKPVYMLRNTFFKKEWEGTPNKTSIGNLTLVDKYKLVTMQKIQHERKIFLPKARSKYFAHTSEVFQLMIHEVPMVGTEVIPTSVALLHHYRHWGTSNDPEHIKVYDDTVPVKYGNKLITSVARTWNKMGNVSMEMETLSN